MSMDYFGVLTLQQFTAENKRLRDTIGSLRAQLTDEKARTDKAQKLAALYLDLLTRRDQCVVCGWMQEIPREPPHCQDTEECAAQVTEHDWRYWAAVASRIEETVRKAHRE